MPQGVFFRNSLRCRSWALVRRTSPQNHNSPFCALIWQNCHFVLTNETQTSVKQLSEQNRSQVWSEKKQFFISTKICVGNSYSSGPIHTGRVLERKSFDACLRAVWILLFTWTGPICLRYGRVSCVDEVLSSFPEQRRIFLANETCFSCLEQFYVQVSWG